ncbi:MAG: hypothetical protein ACD_49C00064G0027 [uncultured bacterium (gcode 4)]|uniref:D-alanyl-D-alanine carboxypeptidase-like core domain-containing protein n=1 Tax=uncultured bacterium (gcode 4) TaxID=1234023 RepID=K2BV81_9BACT|nr:MAG: hypothetical protein ACD_49C00064G0027 [uncultured bacterium (gcode 4)]
MQNIGNRKWRYLKKWIILIWLSLFLISVFTILNQLNKSDNTENNQNKKIQGNINSNTWKNSINSKLQPKIAKQTIIETNKIRDIKKPEYDFFTDLSITKYISNTIHFNDLQYEPEDLITLKWEHLINQKSNSKLRKIALENLENMANAFYDNFKTQIAVVSAYRDYNYQKWIESNKTSCIRDKFCAKAWYSEHQTWLAIDIFETSDSKSFLNNKQYKKYYDWLQENAYKYWFHNTYQKWIDIDWYNEEPWHWRYLWINLAKKLKENDESFWLYFSKNK